MAGYAGILDIFNISIQLVDFIKVGRGTTSSRPFRHYRLRASERKTLKDLILSSFPWHDGVAKGQHKLR